ATAFRVPTLHLHVARSGPATHMGHFAHIRRIVLLVVLLGCGTNPVAAPVDSGQPAPRCSGAIMCDGLLLRACNDGVPGEEVGNCRSQGACSAGRCMSMS